MNGEKIEQPTERKAKESAALHGIFAVQETVVVILGNFFGQ